MLWTIRVPPYIFTYLLCDVFQRLVLTVVSLCGLLIMTSVVIVLTVIRRWRRLKREVTNPRIQLNDFFKLLCNTNRSRTNSTGNTQFHKQFILAQPIIIIIGSGNGSRAKGWEVSQFVVRPYFPAKVAVENLGGFSSSSLEFLRELGRGLGSLSEKSGLLPFPTPVCCNTTI